MSEKREQRLSNLVRPEGMDLEDWQRLLRRQMAQKESYKISDTGGDILTMTVVGVDSENGWPQVAVFEGNVGWPPMANVGVGGKTYPFVANIR